MCIIAIINSIINNYVVFERCKYSMNNKIISKRDKHMIRFIEWIIRYPGWLQLICTPNDEKMTVDMMSTLVQSLVEEEFYEIIFVLFMVHRNSKVMVVNEIFSDFIFKTLLTEWKGEVRDKDQLLKYISETFD